MSRGLRTLCVLTMALGIWRCHIVFGQAPSPDRTNTVKAGILLNFIKYTEWPAERFADEQSPVIVTLVGEPAFAEELRRAVRSYNANPQRPSRQVELRTEYYPAAPSGESPAVEQVDAFFGRIRSSHVAFFSNSEAMRVRDTLRRMQGWDVLTVSDIVGFAESGGMLGMVMHEDRVAFDANQKVIQRTNVKVSSKVLRLARRIVQSGP